MMGNFNFLKKDYPELYQLCSDVAKYIDSDKSISMLKARQAIEFMVKYLGSEADDLFVNINNLEDKNIANSRIIDLFHLIRKKANKSVHNESNADTEGVLDALTEICVWLAVGHDKKNISIIHFNDKEKFFLRKNGYCDDKSVEEDFDVSDAINPLEAIGKFSDEDVEPTDALEQDVFETYEEYCERIESMPPVKIGYAFLDSSQVDDFCGIAFPLFHVSKHSKIEAASVAAFYASDITKNTNIDGILTAKLKTYNDKLYYDYDSVILQDDHDEIPLCPVSWEKYDYETEEQYARRIGNLPLLPVAIAKPIRKEYDLQKQSLPFETISLSYASKYFTAKRILCSVDRDNAKKLCLTKFPFKVYAQIKDIQTVDELQIFNQEQDIVLIVKNNQTSIKKLVDLQFELYLELAQQENVNAQYKAAKCYKNGYGVEKDIEKSFEWFKRAAEQGHVKAQYELAKFYEEKYENAADKQKEEYYAQMAFDWYKRAAELGHVESQSELAIMMSDYYDDGENAFKWFKMAAERGDVKAQLGLGACFGSGTGVELDEQLAFKWVRRAADQGYAEAQFELSGYYGDGIGVEPDEQKEFKWLERAADNGLCIAQYNLAECYWNGKGVEKNIPKAIKWYTRAAEQGDIKAQYNLAECYWNGEGVEKNIPNAIKWYTRAAEQGYIKAQYNLAECYWNGEGVEKNIPNAIKWYTRAAEQRHVNARYKLAKCYWNGDGVEKNIQKAFELYKKLAIYDHVDAQYQLAVCYENGYGVDKDIQKAVKWYTRAAEQGHVDAQYKLAIRNENGHGVDKDTQKEFEWNKRAVPQGHVDAQKDEVLNYDIYPV